MNRSIFLATIIALAFSIVMTVLSAHIRLSDSGIDCSPWPQCFANSFQLDEQPGISIHQDDPGKTMRMFHRLIASLFGLLVLIQFSLVIWYRKSFNHGLLCPGLIMFLTILLAMVGMNTPNLEQPLITFINLSGGMTLTACLYWYLLGFFPTTPGKPVTLVSLIFALLSIATGAWVSANFAAGACEGICLPQGELANAFDPGRTLQITRTGIELDAEQPLILLVHQLITTGCLVVLTVNALLATPSERSVLLLSPVLGMAAVVAIEHSHHSVWLASVHNGLALLILLMLIHQYRRWGTQ